MLLTEFTLAPVRLQAGAWRVSSFTRKPLRIATRTMSGNATSKRQKHRFAPIPSNSSSSQQNNSMKLKGIIFDMDGTLCKTSTFHLIVSPGG